MSEAPPQDTRLAKMSAVLCVAPIIGALFTFVALFQSFEQSVRASDGDPSILSEKIGHTLYPLAIGILLAVVGFPLALWCIFKRDLRPWWLVLSASFTGFLLAWIVLHGAWLFLTRS